MSNEERRLTNRDTEYQARQERAHNRAFEKAWGKPRTRRRDRTLEIRKFDLKSYFDKSISYHEITEIKGINIEVTWDTDINEFVLIFPNTQTKIQLGVDDKWAKKVYSIARGFAVTAKNEEDLINKIQDAITSYKKAA